ncbi:hypothetical protein BDW71DRAFT_190750 [Aspergillus fruticulosus]
MLRGRRLVSLISRVTISRVSPDPASVDSMFQRELSLDRTSTSTSTSINRLDANRNHLTYLSLLSRPAAILACPGSSRGDESHVPVGIMRASRNNVLLGMSVGTTS